MNFVSEFFWKKGFPEVRQKVFKNETSFANFRAKKFFRKKTPKTKRTFEEARRS